MAVGSGVGVTAAARRGVPVGVALAGAATVSEGGVAPAKDVGGETAGEVATGEASGEQEANISTNVVVQTKDRTIRNLKFSNQQKRTGPLDRTSLSQSL